MLWMGKSLRPCARRGLYYGINFGLTLDYILRLAEKQPKSADLARYILSRDVRELKIIGQLIYPEEAVTYEVATQLALSSFSNPELRDYLAKHFFDRIPEAPYWALDWIFTEHAQRWEDLLPRGLYDLSTLALAGLPHRA